MSNNKLIKKSKEIMETFNEESNLLTQLSTNLKDEYYRSNYPINSNILFLWLVIIVIIIYLLFDYMNK